MKRIFTHIYFFKNYFTWFCCGFYLFICGAEVNQL